MTTWSTKIDGVDKVMADDVNKLQTYKLDKDTVPFIRPEDYGAKGDYVIGVGGTDDTAAINAAVVAAVVFSARVMFTSPKIYKTTGPVNCTAPFITLEGSGKAATIYNTGTGQTLKITGASRCVLKSMMLWGNGLAFGAGSTTTHGVELDASSYVIFDTCDIRYHGGHGVYCHGGVWNISFINTHILENAGDGINSRSPSGAEQNGNNMSLVNCAIWENGGNGINWLASSLNITGSNIEGNLLAGVNVDPVGCAATAYAVCIVGNYLEQNRKAQIRLATTNGYAIYGGEISGNYLYSSYAGADGDTALIMGFNGPSPMSLLHIGYNAYYTTGAKLTHWVDLADLPNFTCRVEKMGMPAKFTNLGTATGQNQDYLDAIDQDLSTLSTPTFDAIKLGALSAGAIPCNNAIEFLLNGGFDTDTANWLTDRCTIASVPGGRNGGNCLELTMVSGATQYAYQFVTGLTIGAHYVLSGWVKSGTAGDGYFSFKTNETPFVGTISSGTWTRYSVNFVATMANNTIDLYKDSATAGTIFFDDVSLVELLGFGDSTISVFGTNTKISLLPSYATDADAGTGGLVPGELYTVLGTSPLQLAVKI